MATLNYFPNSHCVSSYKLFISSPILLQVSQTNLHIKQSYSSTRIYVSSSIKPPSRVSKKCKSNEELRNDIREFLSSVGLPQNHVPYIKELSQYGRQDLANIVRRRGYKFIRQLLEIPPVEKIDTCPNEELEVIGESKGQNELNLSKEGDFPSCRDIDEVLKFNGQTSTVSESATLSLEAKVVNFIENGELDAVEDSEFGITYDRYVNEEERTIEAFNHQKQKSLSLSSSSNSETLNGDIRQSIQNAADRVLGNRNSSIEVQDHGTDLTIENAENQAEVEHLKFFLRQKELELTQLKQQVEKEKHALSVLQATAEAEIIKAQSLISEKETELQAAEESLSGLKEVEVQYSGEGKTVELAGSFNGWHHKIRMEPYSSSTTHSIGSRASQLWGAVLWLYPGVYEIKFVIDGHWETDPQREICTRNGMSNNILRVDR